MSTSSQEKLKCPIKINFGQLNGPVDTKEEVAVKWEAIKQWYRDHPETEAPWDEWKEKIEPQIMLPICPKKTKETLSVTKPVPLLIREYLEARTEESLTHKTEPRE